MENVLTIMTYSFRCFDFLISVMIPLRYIFLSKFNVKNELSYKSLKLNNFPYITFAVVFNATARGQNQNGDDNRATV